MRKFLSLMLAMLLVVSLVPMTLLVASAGADSTLPTVTEDENGRLYYYYESFETDGAVQGADNVMSYLGWKLPANERAVNRHNANVLATEGNEDDFAYFYEIRNGKLYVRHRGDENSPEQMIICDDSMLGNAVRGAYTVEYTMTYLPTTTNTSDGYFTLLYAYHSESDSFGSAQIRVSGFGNNQYHMYQSGTDKVVELDAGDQSANYANRLVSASSNDVRNDINPTLYERLFGNLTVAPGLQSGRYTLSGGRSMVGREFHVKMEFDGLIGPRVTVNGVDITGEVLVSDPYSVANDDALLTAKKNYLDLVSKGGYALGLYVSGKIDCAVDDIMVYSTYSADATDGGEKTPMLAISEVALFPENEALPYIEIYNMNTESVNLADYVLGFANSVTATYVVDGALPLTQEDLTLAAGGIAVIFPVDAANDAAVAAAANNAEGFRAAYGIPADVPVLTVNTDAGSAKMQFAFSHGTTLFLSVTKDDWGADVNFTELTVEELPRKSFLQSVISFVPSMVQGKDSDLMDESFEGTTAADATYNFGGAGVPERGYSAHYVYGLDAATNHAKVGLLMGRRYATIEEEQNVGKLLPLQETYFSRLEAALAAQDEEEQSVTLVITEMVPRTKNLSRTQDIDAFEAFELTNIGKEPVNLYEYGIVANTSAYGGLDSFDRVSPIVLSPTATDSAQNAYLATLQNPTTEDGVCMIASGDSVVLWNIRETTLEAGAADGTGSVNGGKCYTIADFRTYHGLAETVPVVAVASFAQANGVVAENEGTTSYGVAKMAGGEVESIVSDVTLPVVAAYFNVSRRVISAVDLAELGNYLIVAKLVTGGFATVSSRVVAKNASLAGCHQTETRTDAFGNTYTAYIPYGADEKASARLSVKQLKDVTVESNLPAITSMETVLPADYSVSFSYGKTNMALSSGALLSGLETSDYRFAPLDAATAKGLVYVSKYGDAPVLLTSTRGGADENHSLGTVVYGQLNDDVLEVANPYFTLTYQNEAGEDTSVVYFRNYRMVGSTLTYCRGAYTILPGTAEEHWVVTSDDRTEPYTANGGEKIYVECNTVVRPSTAGINSGSVTLREGAKGIRFTTSVQKDLYQSLVATYGAENVSCKTAIMPTAYVAEAGVHTVEALDKLTHSTNYLVVESQAFFSESEHEYCFAGSLLDIKDDARAFSGIGYIEVTTAEGVIRFYGNAASASRSVVSFEE